MYHNQPNMIEMHDDVVGVEKAKLEAAEGQPVRLHLTYILRPDRLYTIEKEADVRLHTTNGVNHRYTPINSPDPALDMYAERTPAQAVLNGQNAAVAYNEGGNAYVTPEGSMLSTDATSNAPLGAADSRHYLSDLSYHAADFNDGETDASRALRRQQSLIDETTAKKRKDGSGAGNANSMRSHEAEEERRKQDEQAKDDKRDSKARGGDELKSGDAVRLEREKKG